MTRRTLILFAGLGSAALLGGAFLFQFLGYAPCAMCLWQRWPHAAAIAIAGLGVALPSVWLAVLGGLSALTTAGIGLFHTGVERGLWDGPSTCTSSSTSGLSTDELMAQIMSAPLVRCDEVPWELFTLSMASWNALFSLGLAGIWLMAAKARA